MANIIIRPEHQSAPKAVPIRHSLNTAGGVVHTGDYDREMDAPEYHAATEDLPMMDKSPNQTIEQALRQHEKNVKASRPQRWEGQERWQGRENEEMRLVRIYHPNVFMRMLQAAGVSTSFNTERSQHVRLWLNDFERVGRVGVNAWVPDEETGRKIAKTVATLQVPAPEYTIMRFNEYNVPTNERYHGWRTTLLDLITSRAITEEEAERAFGPAIGIAGAFYRKQLYDFRNKS